MALRRQLVFANSVDYARHTGGWVYNTRVMRELSALGWDIVGLDLPAGFPRPDAAGTVRSLELVAEVPDGAIVMADQICLSPLADVVAREAQRLRFVMIFHHPIAKESGLPEAERARFADLERRAVAACALVVASSSTTARELSADYGVAPDRIAVAPPGIEKFAPAERPDLEIPRLLSVGALIPRKGYDVLIAALAGLRDRPWRLDIVGDADRVPEYASELRTMVRTAGLDGRVVLHGGLTPDALEACWRLASIYVSASRHEGYGMAVAEAIARGLPTVTTRAGAVGDWLDPSAAILVADDQPETLRAALVRVLDEPDLRKRLRQAALEQGSRFQTWNETAETIHEQLAQL
jgi:glycosyltransferase involved in cell wall biosynthesis